MRESIGTVSLLNFIIFFIFLVFAFLMGTYSYYKAYRVNNAIVASIEKYEGYNQYAQTEIEQKLDSFGYNRMSFKCGNVKNGTRLDNNENGSDKRKHTGYCIYLYKGDDKDTSQKTDTYNSYEVKTIITFQFPIIQNVLKLRVSSRTHRIYDFVDSKAAMDASA